MRQKEVEVSTSGSRTERRNRALWESYYSGWDRASLNLPPDPPEKNEFGWPDPEHAEYHRKGHLARVLAGRIGETPRYAPPEYGKPGAWPDA